jgi:hypothetical protein
MMASEKDLLDKADALLRRHALGPGGETGTYPVLTDLVVPPELRQAGEAEAQEPAAPATEAPAPPAQSVQSAQSPQAARDELVGRVLIELRARLAPELEREVAEALAPQLRAAVGEVLDGLQERLAALVAEAVAKALEERSPVK